MLSVFTTIHRSGGTVYYRFKTKSAVSICRNQQIFTQFKRSYLKVHSSKNQPLPKYQLQNGCPHKNRYFRTTSTLHIPPLLALLLRPVLRLSAFFLGRKFKHWWHKKSEKEKEEFVRLLKTNRNVFYGSLALLSFSSLLYYVMHIETDPITGRRRFIIFNEAEQAMLGKLMLEIHLQEHQKFLLDTNHPLYSRLAKIVDKILKANQDLILDKDKPWTLTVVDSPLKNAYVLPGRNIFFFSGTLNIIDNDDQLAIIIAHEMAHALLLHSIEQFSNRILLDVILTIPILLIWAWFPDIMAFFLQYIGNQLLILMHSLPYSRALENEADDVGLKLAAKACMDVREAVVFWGKMRILTELNQEPDIVTWLSTHPAHADREQSFNRKMPKVIELMKTLGCPALNSADPRQKFYERTMKDHELYFKQKGVLLN